MRPVLVDPGVPIPPLPDPTPELAEFRARLDAYLAAGRKARAAEGRQRKMINTLLADLQALGCAPEPVVEPVAISA